MTWNFILGTDPSVLGPTVQAYLMQEEALNNLLLGIIEHAHHKSHQPERTPHMLKVVDDGHMLLVGVMIPPQKLVLYSHKPPAAAVFSGLAEQLRAAGWRIPGVLGRIPLAARFAAAWQAQAGYRAKLGMRQRAFWLRQVTSYGQVPGRLRLAVTKDLDLLSQWMYDFHREVWADTVPQDLVLQRHSVKNMIDRKALYVWENMWENMWENNAPVSMAAQTRPSPNGIAINAVYTPPEQRGKGYATACVAALSRHLLDDGRQFCSLFTDLANPTSNRMYQRIGYEALDYFEEWVFMAE